MRPFNSYTEGLDLEFLKDYCTTKGELRKFSKGDFFESEGDCSKWIAFVKSGYFKYLVDNKVSGKQYITGIAFENEFVADYPNCLYHRKSQVSIVAGIDSEVYLIKGETLRNMYEQDTMTLRIGKDLGEKLFTQTYTRFLDSYRLDPRGRYEKLLSRCPHIVQRLSLKEIASFLNVTPKTISLIRKEITFGCSKS